MCRCRGVFLREETPGPRTNWNGRKEGGEGVDDINRGRKTFWEGEDYQERRMLIAFRPLVGGGGANNKLLGEREMRRSKNPNYGDRKEVY